MLAVAVNNADDASVSAVAEACFLLLSSFLLLGLPAGRTGKHSSTLVSWFPALISTFGSRPWFQRFVPDLGLTFGSRPWPWFQTSVPHPSTHLWFPALVPTLGSHLWFPDMVSTIGSRASHPWSRPCSRPRLPCTLDSRSGPYLGSRPWFPLLVTGPGSHFWLPDLVPTFGSPP